MVAGSNPVIPTEESIDNQMIVNAFLLLSRLLESCGLIGGLNKMFKLRLKPKKLMNTTISVICYKSKTLSNGEHPLMLRIAQNGKSRLRKQFIY